jgi:hypothetical protein
MQFYQAGHLLTCCSVTRSYLPVDNALKLAVVVRVTEAR